MSFTEDELYMRTETDLSKVKAAAEMLLMTDIHETPYSPMVVQHPFTSSGIVGVKDSGEMKILDITENQENLRLWQTQMRKMIVEADSAFQIYMLVNKPYALMFLKFSEPYLSQEDLSKILASAWIISENPNSDANLTKRRLVSLFRSADPSVLMDEDERQTLAGLDETVTVYRGVTRHNANNVRALSWTLDYDTAKWFASRFGESGTIYEARINKERILALFKGRNEAEVIIDPKDLRNIRQRETLEFGMNMKTI